MNRIQILMSIIAGTPIMAPAIVGKAPLFGWLAQRAAIPNSRIWTSHCQSPWQRYQAEILHRKQAELLGSDIF